MSQLIIVSIRDQRLQLLDNDKVLMDTAISTAMNGPGEVNGSECTPRGWHYVRAKIGANADADSVFIGRRFSGEIYTPALSAEFPDRDWILTRILWLSGLEPGKNRLGNVDTMRRYIYIHGCPDEDDMGIPSSHGCIKMHNEDVINLFEVVPVGVRVLILEGELPPELPLDAIP